MDDFRESNLEMEDDINYGFDPVPSGTGSKTITLFIGTDAEWDSQGAVSCQIDIKTKFQGNTFRQKYILLNKKFEDKICLKKIILNKKIMFPCFASGGK